MTKLGENKNEHGISHSDNSTEKISDEVAGQANLLDLIDKVAEKVDPVVQLIQTIAQKHQEGAKARAKFKIQLVWVAVVVIGLILIGATFMTYAEKMAGSTYGFLLGTIVGYALTLVTELINPSE